MNAPSAQPTNEQIYQFDKRLAQLKLKIYINLFTTLGVRYHQTSIQIQSFHTHTHIELNWTELKKKRSKRDSITFRWYVIFCEL